MQAQARTCVGESWIPSERERELRGIIEAAVHVGFLWRNALSGPMKGSISRIIHPYCTDLCWGVYGSLVAQTSYSRKLYIFSQIIGGKLIYKLAAADRRALSRASTLNVSRLEEFLMEYLWESGRNFIRSMLRPWLVFSSFSILVISSPRGPYASLTSLYYIEGGTDLTPLRIDPTPRDEMSKVSELWEPCLMNSNNDSPLLYRCEIFNHRKSRDNV